MDLDTIRFIVKQLILECVAIFCLAIVLCVMSVCFLVFVSFVKEEIGSHIKKICLGLAPGAIFVVEEALKWQAFIALYGVLVISVGLIMRGLFQKYNPAL